MRIDCMTGSGSPVRCLVDPAVLEQLRRELDDDAGWLQFLSNYLAHLPRRIEKLRAGLETKDFELSMDAVLSLKISCQMVGAERLAGLALQMQRQLGISAGPEQAIPERRQLIEMFDDIAALAGHTAAALGVRFAQEESGEQARICKTDDYAERCRAFQEKREPTLNGRKLPSSTAHL